MKASGNPTQWGDNFPPQELLEEDIDSNRLFLYVVNGQIEAVFAFILGADPTYAASGWTIPCPMARCTVWHRPESTRAWHRQCWTGAWSTARACVPTPTPTTRSCSICWKRTALPAAASSMWQTARPALPTRSLHPAAGLKQNTPPKSPGLRMQSLPCRTAHAGFFVCPRSLRPAPLDGDGENKAANGQTCPCYKYRSTENPHGHRPECKFVNEKCLKTLSFLCRMCYNNTRPCVRDRKLYAIGVQ